MQINQHLGTSNRWFYFFLITHFFCWALVPMAVRYNLPLDSIEGTIWGQHLQWGYDKNPFLNGWFTRLAVRLDGHNGWMTYFFSQISVVLCFWAVWKLAKNFLPSVYALLAVMILEGVQYYHLHAIDFNDNTLELSLWALTTYFFYLAVDPKKSHMPTHFHLGAWIVTGLFAGLGMMAKYYTASLLVAMFLFLLFNENNRKHFTAWPPYAGVLVFLIIILPHFIWLCLHEFITVIYVFHRTSSQPSWFNHIFYPAKFAWQQAEVFLPAFLLFLLLLVGKKPLLLQPKTKLTSFDREFLFFIGLGPFLLTLFLSLLTGITLRAGWGMPLLSLWGILCFVLIQPRLSSVKLEWFMGIFFTLMLGFVIGYAVLVSCFPRASSANFPGTEIAEAITKEWHQSYHTKLAYVAGSRWISGNISFYSIDHPAVFIEWDQKRAPWIDTNKLLQKGAVFVWDITNKETLPIEIRKKFPQLGRAEMREFSWKRDKNIPSIKIGMAFLPPSN